MELWNVLLQIPMPVVVLVVAILIFVTVVVAYQYAKMKGLDGIREDVYQLILTAERAYNYGDNKQKLKYVVQEARKLLPNWLQVVLSDYILERTVEAWFKGVKDLLDDGKVNGSQKSCRFFIVK